jgi:hypothetical protein
MARREVMKGYLYVLTEGAPVFVYARGLATIALSVGVRGDDKRNPDRAAKVRAAAEGAVPGLYRATCTLDGTVWTVARGKRIRGSVLDEIGRHAAVARRRTPGKFLTTRELTAARLARATADALRAHVLPHALRTVP